MKMKADGWLWLVGLNTRTGNTLSGMIVRPNTGP